MRNDAREIEGVMVVAFNVTDQVLARKRIEESEARFRFLAESIPQKVFTATPAGDADYFNPQWMEFTGLSFEDLKSWGWTQIIHPAVVEENVRVWKHSLDTGEPFQFDHRLRRKDGQYRWHLTRALPMRDEKGNITKWFGSSTDIHDQAALLEQEQAARQEAERANQLKVQFLGMISHELRTPLTSIKGFASTLMADDVTYSQEDVRQFIAVINEEADNLTELVEQLLEVSSLQAGKLQITPALRSLRALLSTAQPQLERIAKEHPLTIHLPPALPQVMVDEKRFVQVLANLAQNAAKFSPVGSEIAVDVTLKGKQVQLDVIDHGSGIPASAHEVVFEAFRQLERKGKAGAGLGLAICKGLVEAHGGQIWIQNTPGGGTTVSFTLPVAQG